MNKNDKLLERLRDDLEWAEIFQYEIPVTLPDDLREVIQILEGKEHETD